MLHIVVLSHGPETCAAAKPQAGAAIRRAAEEIEAAGARFGASLQGWWVDAPGHVQFVLLDAPSAHAVNGLMQDLKLFHWNTVRVHAVQTLADSLSLMA